MHLYEVFCQGELLEAFILHIWYLNSFRSFILVLRVLKSIGLSHQANKMRLWTVGFFIFFPSYSLSSSLLSYFPRSVPNGAFPFCLNLFSMDLHLSTDFVCREARGSVVSMLPPYFQMAIFSTNPAMYVW